MDAAQGLPIALSDAALKCLTKLTCLQLQVSSKCYNPRQQATTCCMYMHLLPDAIVHAICIMNSRLYRSEASAALHVHRNLNKSR